MSISEKLVTIAENQQRVFDAGRNSGGGGGDYSSGYSDGYDSGFNEGYDSGYWGGYDEGQTAEYDRFWDAYQQNGNRTDYGFAFSGRCWTEEIFKPKHLVQTTTAERMFFRCMIKDLVLDGKVDLSQATTCNYLFAEAHIESIDLVDLSGCPNMADPFYYVPYLHTIGKLKLADHGNQTFSPDWMYTTNLENLTIEGTIGNDVSFWLCGKLSKASITSIINHLSTTASGKTATFSRTAVTNAFGSTTASAWTTLVNSKKNWTISLV